jgi:hypothetical protein
MMDDDDLKNGCGRGARALKIGYGGWGCGGLVHGRMRKVNNRIRSNY